jgi:DNA-binding GntR family transcriptional regulator
MNLHTPIQVTASVAKACEVIRDGIRSGAYPGGAWIREMVIAELAQVSRTSVRQALNVLALEGFVEMHPNRGAMVIDWSDDNLLEVFDVRVMLESYACELAAQRASAQDLERMARQADRFSELAEKASSRQRHLIAQTNNELHLQILAASGNQRLASLLVAVVQVPMVHQTFARYEREDLRRSASQHQDLVQAIRRRDSAWARAAMQSHILAGKQVIFAGKSNPSSDPGTAS